MKKLFKLRLLITLACALLTQYSCQSESLPESNGGKELETSEALDSYHDKFREHPYPKADNELYLNPPRSSYPNG